MYKDVELRIICDEGGGRTKKVLVGWSKVKMRRKKRCKGAFIIVDKTGDRNIVNGNGASDRKGRNARVALVQNGQLLFDTDETSSEIL